MNTTVTGIPSYGMVGKRVESEARRYVDEMASVPKSVYDTDKITIHVSSVSPYPYANASGMTLDQLESFLKNMTPAQKDSLEARYKQYAEDARRDLQKLTGENVPTIKGVRFDPEMEEGTTGPINYKNNTITAKWNF